MSITLPIESEASRKLKRLAGRQLQPQRDAEMMALRKSPEERDTELLALRKTPEQRDQELLSLRRPVAVAEPPPKPPTKPPRRPPTILPSPVDVSEQEMQFGPKPPTRGRFAMAAPPAQGPPEEAGRQRLEELRRGDPFRRRRGVPIQAEGALAALDLLQRGTEIETAFLSQPLTGRSRPFAETLGRHLQRPGLERFVTEGIVGSVIPPFGLGAGKVAAKAGAAAREAVPLARREGVALASMGAGEGAGASIGDEVRFNLFGREMEGSITQATQELSPVPAWRILLSDGRIEYVPKADVIAVTRSFREAPQSGAIQAGMGIEIGDFIGSATPALQGPRGVRGIVEGEGILGTDIPAWRIRGPNGEITAIAKDDAQIISKGESVAGQRALPLKPTARLASEGVTPPPGAVRATVETAAPVPPSREVPVVPDMPLPAGFRFAAPLRDFGVVESEVVTSDNVVVRGLVGRTGINPSILQNTPVGKAIVGFERQSVAASELADVGVSAALDPHAQRWTGRLGQVLNIDESGIFRGTNKRWEDVFSRPGDFPLSKELKSYLADYRQVIDEVETLRVAHGLKPRAKTGPEGWFYVPRQVKGIHGVELRRPSNPNLQRLHDEATEGMAQGIDYSNNPRANLELHIRTAYREMAEKQLSDALEPLSITPRALVPEPVRIRLVNAITKLRTAEREARREIQSAAVETKKAPMPSTFARKTASFPEVQAARVEYNTAKSNYTRAMESARKKEVAPGALFGLTEEAIPIRMWRNRFFPREQADELNRVFQAETRGMASPWVRGLEFTGNHVRFLSAVGDFAAPLVQGLPVLADNPVRWAQATFNHYLAWLDPTVQARFLRSHLEDVQEMAQHGIPVGDPEFFAALRPGGGTSLGKPIEMVFGERAREVAQQVGRQTFGRFQAGYNTFLGESRILLWNAKKTHWEDKAELASLIRNMTGGLDSRALGVLPAQRAAEGMWLAFSPRLLRSTVALVADAARPTTQRGRESLRILSQLAAGAVGIYIATGVALRKSEEEIKTGLNPLNGKRFLSHEINGDWIGIGGQLRAISQLVAKSITKPEGFTSSDQFDNPLIAFYMSRGAPAINIVGGVAEAATGTNILPFEQIDDLPDLAKHIGTSALPFAVQGVLEGQQSLTTGAGVVGFRTSTRREPTLNDVAQELYGVNYDDLPTTGMGTVKRTRIRKLLKQRLSPKAVEAEKKHEADLEQRRQEREQRREEVGGPSEPAFAPSFAPRPSRPVRPVRPTR